MDFKPSRTPFIMEMGLEEFVKSINQNRNNAKQKQQSRNRYVRTRYEQHQILEFSTCWSALKILDLPAFVKFV